MSDGHQENPARTSIYHISAELGETELCERREKLKEKKVIHFSSGETVEVEDSEEEEESSPQRNPFQDPAEKTRLSFRKTLVLFGRVSLMTCDFLGKRFAGALGLNVAKYQYAMDQYHRDHKAPRSRATERPAESSRLSSGAAGSRYGTTGCAAAQDRNKDLKEGYHNRGYQEDEETSE